MACAFYQQRQLADALEYLQECENIASHNLNIVHHSQNAELCKTWIQRIEDEMTTDVHQIPKIYGA